MLDLTRPRPLPARADVVVVGGGITGVALLHWFHVRGINAVVLERDVLASGATGRNAGFIVQGAANYALASERFGRDAAREIWDFTAENHELLRDALPLERVRYRRNGGWALASSAEEAEYLERSASLLREDGFAAEWRPYLPGRLERFLGGVLNPMDGEVDSAACVRALAEAVGNERIFEDVEVEGVDFSAGGCHVHTLRGVVACDAVVVAANAWAPQVAPGLRITAQRGQMLATAPLSDVVVDRPVHTHWGYRYWRQLADGRVVLGGFRDAALEEESTLDAVPTEPIQSLLERHLRDVMGVDAEITHRWAGIMGFTPDGLPLVGRLSGSPNGFVSAGYSGHGMAFAFNCARRLVALLVDGAEPPGWLSPSREFVTATDPATA